MKVVHLSRTALAAAPYELSKCLNKYADIESRWIALKTDYNDGRVFPADLIWGKDDCYDVLEAADVIHVHNEPFPGLEKFSKKPMVVQFHSCPIRACCETMKRAQNNKNVYTISQPMQIEQYKLPALPNLIDVEEYEPLSKVGTPTIVFAPTNSFARGHIGSKASDEVIDILKQFEYRAVIDIFKNVSYEDNLERKKIADIIIDDLVNETFHRTSLEGACFGLAVLTSSKESGFMYTDLDNLADNINLLLNDGKLLAEHKRKSREWVLRSWHPKTLVKQYLKAYKTAIKGG